jgi:hypothetical protein
VRLIKLALISVILLFFVATAISLMIPGHIRISKAINIHSSKDSIFALLDNRDRWPQWHPAFAPGDSTRSFPSINVVTKSRSDSELVLLMQQGAKKPVQTGWRIYGHEGVDSLTLQWYMDFYPKWYPWQKFGSLFYENTYGVMMEEGLSNLKRIAEGPSGTQ